MGDRVNIVLKDEREDGPCVVIYLHWGYTDRHLLAAEAIKHAEPRWYDSSYCARMIISHILKDTGIDSETGAGIYAATIDDVYSGNFYTSDFLVIDLGSRTVHTDGMDIPFATYVTLTLSGNLV